jgi:hypothetical protein
LATGQRDYVLELRGGPRISVPGVRHKLRVWAEAINADLSGHT